MVLRAVDPHVLGVRDRFGGGTAIAGPDGA
jgi:hypothetical protein